MEIAGERIDEMFFFKIPIVYWCVEAHCYELHPEKDEDDNEDAMQCYLDDNYDQLYTDI